MCLCFHKLIWKLDKLMTSQGKHSLIMIDLRSFILRSILSSLIITNRHSFFPPFQKHAPWPAATQ